MEDPTVTYQPVPQESKLLDSTRIVDNRGPNKYQDRIKNQQ